MAADSLPGEPLDLEPIKAREKAATTGPWLMFNGFGPCASDGLHRVERFGNHDGDAVLSTSPDSADVAGLEADWEFLAHARQDIPALIAEVERLRLRREPANEPPYPTPHELALEALEFAHGAILDAVCCEDGLDGLAGDRVCKLIRTALKANGREWPWPPPEDGAVPREPFWTTITPIELDGPADGARTDAVTSSVQSIGALIAHVGCGSVDEHGHCPLCSEIRSRLATGLPREPQPPTGRCSLELHPITPPATTCDCGAVTVDYFPPAGREPQQEPHGK